MSTFVVKSMKTGLGFKLNESDGLTDSCVLMVLRCRCGSDSSPFIFVCGAAGFLKALFY